MADKGFNSTGFFIRLCVALLLVFASYNPSDYSWFHWFIKTPDKLDPLLILSAIVLVILWAIYLRATIRSLGAVGTGLAVALFGAVIWVLVGYGFLSLTSTTLLQYIILVMLAAIMAVGISWSHIRRRMTGQLDVDDIEE